MFSSLLAKNCSSSSSSSDDDSGHSHADVPAPCVHVSSPCERTPAPCEQAPIATATEPQQEIQSADAGLQQGIQSVDTPSIAGMVAEDCAEGDDNDNGHDDSESEQQCLGGRIWMDDFEQEPAARVVHLFRSDGHSIAWIELDRA